MSSQPQPTNPLSASSLSIDRPSSIASQSSQQSLHNGSYSHMSDTTLGDTSSAASSPREPTREHPEPQPRRNTKQPLTLPHQLAPEDSIASNDSIPFRAQKGYHHSTWARTYHSRPELLLKPQSIEELQKIVCLARKHRRRLVTVGAGHSPSDLTCTSSWMLSLENMSRVLDIQTYDTSATTTAEDPAGGFGLTSSDTHPDPKQAPPRYAGRALVQAGITLENLNLEARNHGLTLPNLGSIHIQSLAGAIATATHGSSMRHGILSSSVRGLRIMLASGELRWCSAISSPDLFQAALVSLGALGVITEIEIELAPQRNIEWSTTLWELDAALAQWHEKLWTQQEFVRCWWMPYTRRLVVWKGDKTHKPAEPPASSSALIGWLGFHGYQSLLLIANWVPRFTPTVEWLCMGLAHGFSTGPVASGIEEQRTALLMDCLYSQFVNEWAIPFEKGPEAITRFDAWLRGKGIQESGIPFDNTGLYAHAPIEVRVGNTGASERAQHQLESQGDEGDPAEANRAFLDPTCEAEPTLYLNATLYRPYGAAPPWKDQYYAAFEWLMKEMGGRPHWAKNFSSVTREDFEKMYATGLKKWRNVRSEVDPQGVFCGEWHRRLVLEGEGPSDLSRDLRFRRMECEEVEVGRRDLWRGGVMWEGAQAVKGEEKETMMRDELMKSVTKNSPDR